MEIQLGENKVSFKQTSKNIWFCDTLDIYCNSVFDGIAIADKAISDINKMLLNKNKAVKKKIQEKETKK